jgi:hypothetical protein
MRFDEDNKTMFSELLEERTRRVLANGSSFSDSKKRKKEAKNERKMFKESIKAMGMARSIVDERYSNIDLMAASVISKIQLTGDVKGYVELAKLSGDYNEKVEIQVNEFDKMIREMSESGEKEDKSL